MSSRLDNMNSFLYDDELLKKLELIQNQAARIVKKQNKYCHVTPILQDLHWLPVQYKIQFKILLLVFNSIHGEGPVYLASMLEEYHPSVASFKSALKTRFFEKAFNSKK